MRDGTKGSWTPLVENVTCEGFEYNTGITKEHKKKHANMRIVLKGMPIIDEIDAIRTAEKTGE